MAGPRPLFQAPFPCGQTWDASTYNGHWPNQNSIDLARRNRNGENISEGEPVLASADGIVADVLTSPGGDHRIYVDHGEGWMTHYIHHKEVAPVQVGQFVAQGEQIATTSNSGAVAVHIHYTQLRDGEAVRIAFNGSLINTHAGNLSSYNTWGSDNAEEIPSLNCPPVGLRFAGVFGAGTGGHGLWIRDTWAGFVNKWQTWSGQGLRLIDLEITGEGSERRYSGVFRAGTGGHGLWVRDTWAGFVNKWQTWSRQGLRLIDLEITQEGSERRYSGVFRAGTGGHGLWVRDDWAGFVDKWQTWSGQGLRLIDLEITQEGTQRRYSGVFRQGSGGYGLWVDDYSGFVNKWMAWNDQGLRLIDLEVI